MQKEYKTKSKDYIWEYIRENKQRRFSVADIHAYLTDKHIGINVTTIYRNLDKMTENGLLLKFKNNKEDYCVYQYHEPGAHCHEHLHIQCNSCGKIVHIDEKLMDLLNSYLDRESGFVLDCENSVLQGFCHDCYAERKAALTV